MFIRIITTFGIVVHAAKTSHDGVDTEWWFDVLSPEPTNLASIYVLPALTEVTKLRPYEDRELGSIFRFIYACEGSYNRFKDHYTTGKLVYKKDCDLVISNIIKLTDKRANTVALSHAARVVSCTVASVTKAERARLTRVTLATEAERVATIKEREGLKVVRVATDELASQLERENADLQIQGATLLVCKSEHQVRVERFRVEVAEFRAFKKAELERLEARAFELDMRESVKTLANQARLIAQELIESTNVFDYDPTAARQKAAGVLQAAGALC